MLGHDSIYGVWFLKKFASINDRLALQMSRSLEEANIPEWITKEKTVAIQKDHRKASPANIDLYLTYDGENPNRTD